MPQEKHALVAFGGNAPWDGREAADTIRAALGALADQGCAPAAISRMFRTPCFPAGAGPDFANLCAVLQLPEAMAPQAVLDLFHRVEALFGRQRQVRWGARTLDIDLLALGDAVLPDRATFHIWKDLPAERQSQLAPQELILPHPRIQDRAFVLVPLCDVAADWRHPVLGQSVAQMCAALPDAERASVVPM